MQCELCGNEGNCKPALVDGVKMMVCQGCMRHGKAISVEISSDSPKKSPDLKKIKKPKQKDVYKDMNKELVTNWNNIIKNARQKKGLSREQLGFKIGERTVTISKIENGDLRPSDEIAKKLEKELDISLFEEINKVPSYMTSSTSKSSLTLGDFIKKE